jgi:hypothetical protein
MSLFCDAEQELSWTPSVAAYSVASQRKKEMQVPVQSLDGYLRDSPWRPNLVKIDVEGAELDVLRGAQRMLLVDRPVVLLEVHDRGARHQAEARGILQACGYVIGSMGTRGRETFCVALPRPAGELLSLAARIVDVELTRERLHF